MRTYLIGATTVKALVTGAELYKSFLANVATHFLSGFNVSRDVVSAIEEEAKRIEKWLNSFRPGHEFAYESLSEDDRAFLRHLATLLLCTVEKTLERYAAMYQNVNFKELEELKKKLQEALESVHLEVGQRSS